MGGKHDRGRCIYCKEEAGASRDHVPPQNLFPRPLPSTLITVPSCEKCNKSFSKDDEYFRAMISMRKDIGENTEVKKVLPALYRSLQRPEQRGFATSLAKSWRRSPLVTRSGIYIGTVPTYEVDYSRLDRVLQRILKGLYFHEVGTPVPDSYALTVYSVEHLQNLDVKTSDHLMRICRGLVTQPQREVAKHVFSYWCMAAGDDPGALCWAMTFYDRLAYLGLTFRRPAAVA
jgi:hypothetical protein